MANNFTAASVGIRLTGAKGETRWLKAVLTVAKPGMTWREVEDRLRELGVPVPPPGVDIVNEWPGCEWEVNRGVFRLYGLESFNPESAAPIIQAYLAKFDPNGIVTFQWATICDRPHVGEFGGGACVVTAEETFWFNTAEFVANKLKELSK